MLEDEAMEKKPEHDEGDDQADLKGDHTKHPRQSEAKTMRASTVFFDDSEDIADLLHRDGFVLRCKVLDCEAVGTPCTDAISALAASSKILCMGRHSGKIYMMTFDGQVLAEITCHTARVNDMHCVSAKGLMMSCSDDGSVGMFDTTWETGKKHEFSGEKLRLIAVGPDPEKNLSIVISTDKNNLSACSTVPFLNMLWREQIRDIPGQFIVAMKRSGDLLAVATNAGLHIYNLKEKQVSLSLDIPSSISSKKITKLACSLFWENPRNLLVGWGDTIICVCTSAEKFRATSFQLPDEVVFGVYPHKEFLLVFSKSEDRTAPVSLLVVDREGKSLSKLSVPYGQVDQTYASRLYCFTDPVFYHYRTTIFMSSPSDLFKIEFFDLNNYLESCLANARWGECIKLIENYEDRITVAYSLPELYEKHITMLLKTDKIDEAKELCSRICEKEERKWIQYADIFKRVNMIWTLYDIIPLEDPLLPEEIYTLILIELFSKNPKKFRETLTKWPGDLYDNTLLMNIIESKSSKKS